MLGINILTVNKLGVVFFVALPHVVFTQDLSLELCRLVLFESHKKLYANDSVRDYFGPLRYNPTIAEMRSAWKEWSDCVEGKKIPNLSFSTINGKSYTDSSLAGKVLVINFWYKACAPCIAEMPSLNRLYTEFKDENVVFLGFTSDLERNLTQDYLSTNKFLFDIVSNSRDIATKFILYGHPTTFIVDQRGIIIKAWIGYSHDPYEFAAPIIQDLLSIRIEPIENNSLIFRFFLRINNIFKSILAFF